MRNFASIWLLAFYIALKPLMIVFWFIWMVLSYIGEGYGWLDDLVDEARGDRVKSPRHI